MARKEIKIYKIKNNSSLVLSETTHSYKTGADISIVRSGSSINVSMNGSHMLSATDSEFTSGHVVIGASQSVYGSYGAEWIDDVKISAGDLREAIAVWRVYS